MSLYSAHLYSVDLIITATITRQVSSLSLQVTFSASMTASLKCFPLRYASLSYMFDSDLEFPQLSGSQTETENDTPPETPLRSRIPLKSSDFYSCSKNSGGRVLDGLDIDGCSAVVPPPTHVCQPLSLATPNPIRRYVNPSRSFVVTDHDEDYGYDSEHEGLVSARPLRLRSFRHVTRETSRTCYNKSGLSFSRASALSTDVSTPSGILSSLSTPKLDWKPFQGASPSLPSRPRHPSPTEPCSQESALQLSTLNKDSVPVYGGTQSSRSISGSVREVLAAPDLDQEALQRGLASTGVSFRVHKDRRNTASGLGLGWPSVLPADNCRVPTVVPVKAIGELPRMIV